MKPRGWMLAFMVLIAVTASAQPNVKKVTVTLRFTGIVHLVDGTDPAKERFVVVPNHHGFFGGGHHLFVMADRGTFKDTELLNKKESRKTTSTTENYVYDEFPDGYEIDLVASGWFPPASPALTFTEDGDAQAYECPEQGDKTSLHWLPRLSLVTKQPFNVKTSHIKSDPDSSDVLARMDITDGKLVAVVDAYAGRYKFALGGPSNQDVTQAIASYLDYTFDAYIPAGAKYFALRARKFKSKPADADQWIDIAHIAPVNNEVIMTFANVMKSDFFTQNAVPSQHLTHFGKFYDILDNPQKKVKGVERLQQTCTNQGGDSGVECGPDRVP